LTIKVNPARPKITPKQGKRVAGSEDTIDTRIEKGAETARSTSKSYGRDPEQTKADIRVNEALNESSRLKTQVAPGKPTRTTTLIKSKAKPSEIKGAIRNQRKVLRQREITEAAKRAEKAGQ
jgi:hypothetical protein